MVLFVFVMMMLNQGPLSTELERKWLEPRLWIGPGVLSLILLLELLWALFLAPPRIQRQELQVISPEQVGAALFGPYVLGVELASMLLLSGLIGAYHLASEKGARTP